MKKFLCVTTLYDIEDKDIRRVSLKISSKFLNTIVYEDMIEELVKSFSQTLSDKTGLMTMIATASYPEFKRYKLSVIKGDIRLFCFDTEFFIIQGTYVDKHDINESINQIYF